MTIEIFYLDGCPSHVPTVERVKAVLKDLGVSGELLESAVGDPATASALRFLGSPTVRINGVDVEPSARTSKQFGFMCRTYLNGPRREGIPFRALLREALLKACQRAHDDRIEIR